MHSMRDSVRPDLRRLSRRLALGQFLDLWPRWGVVSLFVAGVVALTCRMFVPAAAASLPWLWLAPILAAAPVLFLCYQRAYRPEEVAAIADVLSGGGGVVLTRLEHQDSAWTSSPLFERSSQFALPRVRPWRRLAPVVPAIAFLAVALLVPQRVPAVTSTALADEIAADLEATLSELKQQELISEEEEKKLEEEIERIRQAAEERVDASSWEAVDTLRENMAASLSDKQDAVQWAKDSLERYAAAAQGGASPDGSAEAAGTELMKALEKLAQSGMLANAPPELQAALRQGKLPGEPRGMQQLAAAVSKYLEESGQRLGTVGRLARDAGRFDPTEFPLGADGADGGERPGRGGITRGRADADLTWGKETAPFDRFKAKPLPPGAARSPDDWVPMVELPGLPQESATRSAGSTGRQYAEAAGQGAWRRNLAPRHQRAVKKYFDK